MLKLFALALALVAGAAQADTSLHTDLPLSYLEQTQGDARNQPLVIFLHGFGSNEEDLFGIKDALPSTWTYLSARMAFAGLPRPRATASTTAKPLICSAAPHCSKTS